MTGNKEKIRDGIRKVSGVDFEKQNFNTVQATVNSVDWANRICTVTTNEGLQLTGVRLRAVADSKTFGVVNKPTVNSIVLVATAYNTLINAFVVAFTQIDAISICDGGGNELMSVDLTTNPGKWIWNNGNNNGMVKVTPLTTALNDIQNDLNTIKAVFSGWTPAPGDGGAALKTAAATWYGDTLTVTQQSDIEDTNLKH